MSDYEIIMLLLQVMTVVIAFGALIALICLGKEAYRTKSVCKNPYNTSKYLVL